jgi:hypothetical protein
MLSYCTVYVQKLYQCDGIGPSKHFPLSGNYSHRDTYLEQQKTEKIETNLGERRRYDTNHDSVRLLSRVAFWGGGGGSKERYSQT